MKMLCFGKIFIYLIHFIFGNCGLNNILLIISFYNNYEKCLDSLGVNPNTFFLLAYALDPCPRCLWWSG